MNNSIEIIQRAKECFDKYGTNYVGPEIYKLMDLVSNVSAYKMDIDTNQGYIYYKLLNRHYNLNQLIDPNTIISKFWQGVFTALTKVIDKKYDLSTQMDQLNYLRSYGIGLAKRYINSIVNKYIKQLCMDCGKISNLNRNRRIEYESKCPKCNDSNSLIIHAALSKLRRKCLNCQHIRDVVYFKTCGTLTSSKVIGGCGSSNIILINISESFNDNMGYHEYDKESNINIVTDLDKFIRGIETYIPNPVGCTDNKNKTIFRILSGNSEAKDICYRCRQDGINTCGAESFTLDECVNYSKKIAEFLQITPSLANRRVAKVREYVKTYVCKHHVKCDISEYIYNRLKLWR
jgi:hypothetical protein